jgi:hypothetical protein
MAIFRSRPSERIIHGNVSDSNFRTRGEFLVIVKSVDNCKITLDASTTDHIIIKALTNVLILPSIGLIDEEYDEIAISKGVSIEFILVNNNWYIVSSDGKKITQ